MATKEGMEFLQKCDDSLDQADVQNWLENDRKLEERYGERYILVIF